MSDTETNSAGEKAGRPSRYVVLLFHGVTMLVALVVLLPVALFPVTPGFPGKVAGVILFVAVCAERIWAMYVRQGLARVRDGAGRDWTAIAVGYAYPLTLGGAIAEFLLRQHAPPSGLFATGLAVYATGVAWRYWAFRVLRHQWHVDVSDTDGERHLVREGPYRLMRHPLYFGACLEIVGIPLFLGAWGALLFGVLVFMPLEVARGYYEERFLRELFGADYRRYADDVWAFFPWPVRRRRRP
ncbi:MAG: isoprenylcysteine carboxylmethyltransferase family protein [Lentisphaerae bacterium]|nr:isoprenylcysteine carboxylmethyltransferase family protein [Lentisphaerota bacterium]